jgi:ankyrin repeat protein
VARDRDRNILNSDEEILKAAENGDLPDDFDYMAFNNCKDKWGNTPAHKAADFGHLPNDFDYEAFKGCKNSWGNTPAHLAARNGHLLDDFDYVASQGMTP